LEYHKEIKDILKDKKVEFHTDHPRHHQWDGRLGEEMQN
jgi:hypothetical protein